MTGIEWDSVDHLVEIPGVYDGWSIAVMRDGTQVNRWPVGDPRHAATQDHIDRKEHATDEC